MMHTEMRLKKRPFGRNALAWIMMFLMVLVWSAIDPYDRFTWLLEVAPAIIAGLLLWFTYNRFPLTPLAYSLILIHCLILMVGGHYTYAEVPLFDWIADWFSWNRNHYDKLGHFAQGFVPAIVAREVLIRRYVVNGRVWTALFAFSICLAFSAFYEMLEWWVAVASGEGAAAFLGTQGYEWDTQSDMFFAAISAISALTVLQHLHDRQIVVIDE